MTAAALHDTLEAEVRMALMMLLAHLVGDYLLQWDRLARWKAHALPGVLAHGAIVITVNCVLAVLLEPAWWPWALALGIAHTAVDAAKLPLRKRYPPLPLFIGDQVAHLTAIGAALAASGALAPLPAPTHRLLALALAYVFVTFPVWVLCEFLAYGLLYGSAPEFAHRSHKYAGSVERSLVLTCVAAGLPVLVPVIALPRLMSGPRSRVYRFEWLMGICLAAMTGLLLSGMA